MMKSFPEVSVATLKARSSRYFGAHGRFCASHPWEVIVTTVTLTVCILSMSVLSGGKVETFCGIKKPCHKKSPEEEKADTFLMIIVNSLAILYLYNQFSNLRKVGSKYLLGVAAMFTIIAGFIFGSGVVNYIDSQAAGLNEALPFFLLLIDLSKATALAEFASVSTDRNEVQVNIGKGMALLAPTLTLDTLVEVLIISIGTISGVHQLEIVCYFGCMSLLANYIVFMTFFPASLALILEVCPHNPSNKTWHIDKLAQSMQDGKKPNPVVQRVKLIMALGLVVVHIHSRFLSEVTGVSLSFSSSSSSLAKPDKIHQSSYERVSINDYLRWKIFNISVDQLVVIALGLLFLLKYIFYDKPPSKSLTTPVTVTPTEYPCVDGDITKAYFRRRSITINPVLEFVDAVSDKETHKDSSIEMILSANEKTVVSVGTQTDSSTISTSFCIGNELSDNESETEEIEPVIARPLRPIDECLRIFKLEDDFTSKLSNEEILSLVQAKHIPAYKLEQVLNNPERGVVIRRELVSNEIDNFDSFEELPYTGYDYKQIIGACCENVIGYMPLPVGVAGPLLLDGQPFYIPMCTTEGCLVASTNRGCSALTKSGGISSHVVGDGMTRGPVVRLPNAASASTVKVWLDNADNFSVLSDVFNSTSKYARLKSVHTVVAGRLVYIRFCADTGDAMGMNMLSKGVEKSLSFLQQYFPDIEILSLSGNYCTDKKPSAINWIEGRGKYVVCDATIPSHNVEKVLKTSVEALIDVNISKNLVGSAMAGSIGGFNAHAANIVTAIFIATGQDPAQVVGSSNCITLMERGGPSNQDLYISCTMPSLEVGTVGGGTFLHAQSTCLKMLGVNGSSANGVTGQNASQLARIICGTVLAGELSLLSALAAGHLVRSHLKMNRSQISLPSIVENDSQCNDTKT